MYRNRKDTELNSTKARVLKLETALDDVLSEFAKVIDSACNASDVPPNVAFELSKASLRVTKISQEARKKRVAATRISEEDKKVNDNEKEDDEEQVLSSGDMAGLGSNAAVEDQALTIPHTLATPSEIERKSLNKIDPHQPTYENIAQQWHAPFHSRIHEHFTDLPRQMAVNLIPSSSPPSELTFAQRLHRACIERGLRLVSRTPNYTSQPDSIFPAMAVPLETSSMDQLRASIDYVLRNLNGRYLSAYHSAKKFPVAYRFIEGNASIMMTRTAPVQQLVFGKTRTKVDVTLPELEGEWLEPEDVQEYLEVRGIFVDRVMASTEVRLFIPAATMESLKQSQSIVALDEEYLTAGSGMVWDASLNSRSLGQMENAWQNYSSTGNSDTSSQGSSDYLHRQTQLNDATATELISITLDLIGMIENLARRAICLGPGPGWRRIDVDAVLRDFFLSSLA